MTSQALDTESTIMPPTPARSNTLISNLSAVATRITAASSKLSPPKETPVRLIAVSKLKPASDILALHSAPVSHQHFGENYLQELQEKARLLPPTIKWHFIGGLQSNKCVSLARDTKSLWAVESVDSEKKAGLLDKGWGDRKVEVLGEEGKGGEQLRVFVQVNTSGEENKSGVDPEEGVVGLCRFIREKCPRLKLQGLMTIGAIARSRATTPENENEDFLTLKSVREKVVSVLGLEGKEAHLELSMGMSEDFEGAIVLGSDEVRVGTTIFGDRPPKDQARVV